MGLDGAQRPTRLGGDLVQTQLAEKAQGDDLPIRVIEPADGRPDPSRALRTERGDRRILAARHSDGGRGIVRVDPRDVTPALRSAKRDPDGDPRQPGPEWTIATPAGEAPECGHECLLGSVLGLMDIPEDAVTSANDGGRFMLDEDSERVPIAGQDSLDNGAFIDDLGVDVRRLKR